MAPINSQGEPWRVLVVDDDDVVRHVIKNRLDSLGCDVWTAASAKEALSQIEERGLPHLGIIDVMMPGMNGFELCQQIQSWSDLPVIMLTALSDEKTVVRGIRFFAEDYITKPFRAEEFVARVERVLRRIGDFAYALDPVLEVDERLAVDFAHQRILIDGETVELTPTETKLLYILMRNAGRAVSTSFLLRRLWPNEERYEDVLRVHVYRLRQKIEPDTRRPRYIRTERDAGYRFIR
ncbi:MAG: response regulator transcription factor [Anaerolineae bacterium]|nr:response regulator transcription factor [Anaerolineae bacterium]